MHKKSDASTHFNSPKLNKQRVLYFPEKQNLLFKVKGEFYWVSTDNYGFMCVCPKLKLYPP